MAAGLWFVAGLLAWSAGAIRFSRSGAIDWTMAAAGLFCAAMGAAAWRRTGKTG